VTRLDLVETPRTLISYQDWNKHQRPGAFCPSLGLSRVPIADGVEAYFATYYHKDLDYLIIV